MVKGVSPESIVLPGGAQALKMRSFLSSLLGRAVSANGQHLFPVIPGLSRKARERSGKEEGKKPSRERPYAPCLRDEAWEDAAGFTPDLDDAEPSPGNIVIQGRNSPSRCAARPRAAVLLCQEIGNGVPRSFGGLPMLREEEWGGQGLPNT